MRGAIFDMDGLLIDSEKLWQGQWHEMAAERGLTLGEGFAAEMCGTGGASTFAVLTRYFPDDDPAALLRECSERVHRLEEGGVPLKTGAETILNGLRGAGFRLAVASSSPLDMIRKNLGKAGVLDCFDALTSGHEAARNKPAPDIFLLAARRLELPPEECYVFEDSLNGIEGAWRAGCRPVMVPDLVRPTQEAREQCFGIYADLAEAWEHVRP